MAADSLSGLRPASPAAGARTVKLSRGTVDPPCDMDDTTTRVRDFYEAFSYPSGPPVMRSGFDPRLLLSYGALERDGARPIHVLDAGCGRGMGLVAAASMQPDVRFLGVDVNRVGLRELEHEARRRELANVSTAELDLMTLEGLTTPPGGFDVIHCSGVVHHLTNPEQGLARLAGRLAPHGVLSLMVYSKRGREHIDPIARALSALTAPDEPLEERLRLARQLVESMARQGEDDMWCRARDVDDVEFVDRYLHPQATSYDIESLWKLLEASGLKFLRWVHQADWETAAELSSGPVRERFESLPPREQYRFTHELQSDGKLQLYACLPGNRARPELDPGDVERTGFAVHPEGTFELVSRCVRGSTRIERLTWRDAEGRATDLVAGPLACAGLILREQNQHFIGEALVEALTTEGIEPAVAHEVLLVLLRWRVLYRPHASDMALGNTPLPKAVAGV